MFVEMENFIASRGSQRHATNVCELPRWRLCGHELGQMSDGSIEVTVKPKWCLLAISASEFPGWLSKNISVLELRSDILVERGGPKLTGKFGRVVDIRTARDGNTGLIATKLVTIDFSEISEVLG